MTKKDYELIARAFSDSRPEPYNQTMMLQWHNTMNAIITELQSENNRFNKNLFILACNKVK